MSNKKLPKEYEAPLLNNGDANSCVSSIAKGSFADGIRMINTKGAFIKPTRLTKQRAIILLDCIEEYKRSWYCSHPEDEGFITVNTNLKKSYANLKKVM